MCVCVRERERRERVSDERGKDENRRVEGGSKEMPVDI